MAKSTLKGILGAFLGIGGLALILAGFSGIALSAIFTAILGNFLPGIILATTNFYLYIVGGIILSLVGLKIFFENEEAIGRVLIGLFGVGIIFFSLLIAIAGLTEAATGIGFLLGIFTIVLALLIAGLGFSLTEIGFGVAWSRIVRPVGIYTNTLKKLK